jgi:riboflavin-specific deaminase-like protein
MINENVQRSTPNAQRSTSNPYNSDFRVPLWAPGVLLVRPKKRRPTRDRGSVHRQSASDRPFVMATFAMTVDGKITTRNFSPVDFTSREDKLHLFRQRALADAVLIGHTTLKRDNVRLGLPQGELREARIARGQTPCPIRVIVSNRGKIDDQLKIFQVDISPVLIFSTTRMPKKTRSTLQKKAALHLDRSSGVDLLKMLQTLRGSYHVNTVACEGGPTLFRSMLERGLIDQLNLTIAPYLFGGTKAPTLTGLSREFLPASVHCSLTGMRVVGDECFLTYRIKSR